MANKAVLEFGTSKIICMIDSANIKGTDIPGAACVRYDGIKEGQWVNKKTLLDDVALAIDNAENRIKRQLKSVEVGIPGVFTKVMAIDGRKSVKENLITREFIDEMLRECAPRAGKRWQLMEVRPAYFMDDRGELYIGAPVGRHSRFLEGCFCYMFANTEFLQDVSKLMGTLRLGIDRFVFENVAQAMYYLPAKARDEMAIVADIGYQDTSVFVVYGDAVMAHSVIFAGGATLAEDMQAELNVDEVMAENLKRSYIFGISADRGAIAYAKNAQGKMGAVPSGRVKVVLEKSLSLICQDIKAIIRNYGNMIRPGTPVYIMGAGARMRGVEVFLSSQLGRRVYVMAADKVYPLPPVYTSAIALLDNDNSTVYDLDKNQASGKKEGGFFRAFRR